jgi:hypothetical protein
MAKKKLFGDGRIFIIIIILVGILLLYNQNLYVVSEEDALLNLNKSEEESSTGCTLEITPKVIFAGQEATAKIQDGNDVSCYLYLFLDNKWIKVAEETTDLAGRLIIKSTLSIPGDYTFRAICDLSCTTNTATLTVLEAEE